MDMKTLTVGGAIIMGVMAFAVLARHIDKGGATVTITAECIEGYVHFGYIHKGKSGFLPLFIDGQAVACPNEN